MSHYVAECPNCGPQRYVRPSPLRTFLCPECKSPMQTKRCDKLRNEDAKNVSRDRQPRSYETKRYLSIRVRQFWTPEERAKASERTRARMASPEVRQQIIDGMKAARARKLEQGIVALAIQQSVKAA